MIRRKIVFWSLIVIALMMTACNTPNVTDEDGISIVCTVFPAYDWTCTLLKGQREKVNVEYLFDDGADVHSFQPGADDYVKIAESDIFIYIGGPGTEWIEEALKNSGNEERIVIDLSQANGVNLIENTAEAHHHEDEEEHGHVHVENAGFDEHIWMSLSNAKACVNVIADVLGKKIPGDKAIINQNCEDYMKELDYLDEFYRKEVSFARKTYILVADRFPFRYLAQEYGISYDAAFAGCQTEAEADFDMIIRLATVAEKWKVPGIVVTEVSDKKLAETVLENMEDENTVILVLNSMQAVTAGEVAEGTTYLSVMEENLDVLIKAFPD